jgi:hypothetical protein
MTNQMPATRSQDGSFIPSNNQMQEKSTAWHAGEEAGGSQLAAARLKRKSTLRRAN